MDQISLTERQDNMGQTVLFRDRNLSIIYQGERKELFTEPY